MSITYRLRPEVDTDRFLGGVLAVPGGAIDVKKALDEGNGSIVIDDHEHGKAVVLDDYPPLERVADTDVPTLAPATGVALGEGISLPADGAMRTTELRGKPGISPGATRIDTDDKTEA